MILMYQKTIVFLLLQTEMDIDYSTVLVGVTALLLTVYIMRRRRFSGNLPPGPRGYPLYGNTLALKKWDAKGPGIMDKWAKEFGDLYSIYLGVYPAIVLNSAELAREVLVKYGHKTSGRATNVFFFRHVIHRANKGLAFNEGQRWKDIRRTSLHSMRDFGMGKKSLEHRIQDEARALINHLETLSDKPLDPRLALHNAFTNVIVSIAFGERYEYNDPDFNRLSHNLAAIFSGGGFKNPEIFSPLLTPLIPLTNSRLSELVKVDNELNVALKKIIQEHKERFDPDDITSFIDIYLNAERNGEFSDTNTEDDMFFTIMDLFFAGSETSTTTTRWAILYLIHHPHIQEKCQQVIKETIGQERLPSISDRDKMPFIEATIQEIQRLANIVPYSVMHRVEETFSLSGYNIPEDTLIITNLHAIHKDPRYWKDPERFDPDRWIGQDGKLIRNHEGFIPFGIGPRECIGKSLALQEMFIVLVSLLQKFTFKAKHPNNPPEIAGEIGLVYAPHEFEILLSKW